MQLPIALPTDPILRQTCQEIPIKDLRSSEIQSLVESMMDIVFDRNNKKSFSSNDHSSSSNKGKRKQNRPMTVGLSANQVGIDKKISIVDLAIGHKSFSEILTLINPEIIWRSKSQIEKYEGCVNFPNIWGYVKRSKRIKVKALDRVGNKLELDLTGWSAVLLQHEIDHLNGHLFIDHLEDPTKAHLVLPHEYKLHKKLKKKWNKYIDMSDLARG